jgi:aspartate/methionine/tyrosine aminotransferase
MTARVLRLGFSLLACAAVCSSNATPPMAPSAGDKLLLRFLPSERAVNAAPAIIEEVSEKYLKPGVTNLAAGFSHWGPPEACIEEATKVLAENSPELHRYGACLGIPELLAALKSKLDKENGIRGREIMVTAGANMAFVHVATSLCNVGDCAVLFTPYYFSHRVALELQGITPLYVACDDDLIPSAAMLTNALAKARTQGLTVKMVTIVTPGNPSGAVIPAARLQELIKVCADNKVWLVSDETYEYFTYDDAQHVSPHAPDGVINIFRSPAPPHPVPSVLARTRNPGPRECGLVTPGMARTA